MNHLGDSAEHRNVEALEGELGAPDGRAAHGLGRLLESVFSTMAEGLVVTDQDGRFVFFNAMAEQLLGNGALDVPLTEWPWRYGLYLPDKVTLFPFEALPLSRALRGEIVRRTEIFMRHATRPEGAWLSATAHPLRDEAGVVRGAVTLFDDVTSFKQAEEALRQGEEKYRSLYNNTPVMMHSIDQHGRLVSVSETWLDTLGYTREEVLGRNSVEFLTPESREYAREHVLPEYFRTGSCRDVPYQMVKKNGERIDVLLSAITDRDAEGNTVRSLAVLINVTERKRAEEALLESERRLRSILDNTTAIVFLVDPRSRYIFVNRQWELLFHHTRWEVAGKSVRDVFPPELADSLVAGTQAVIQSREPLEQEEQAPQDDGLHTYLMQKFPLIDSNGVLYAICGIATDITERKRAEVAQRLLAETSRELVTSFDYETTLQRVAELLVPTMADLGVIFVQEDGAPLRPVAVADSTRARARSVREFLLLHPQPPDASRGPAKVMNTRRSAVSRAAPGLLGRPIPKAQRWESLRVFQSKPSVCVPLRARGRCLGVLALISTRPHGAYGPADVPLIEELGRRAAFAIDNAQLYRKAQESIRARDEFLSIASHELKTPLTSMKLRMQQMKRSLDQPPQGTSLEGRVSSMLEVFDDQLLRLKHLVDHLLDVSCINESRLDLRLEEVDLSMLARAVAGHLAEPLHKAGCVLELEILEPVRGIWDRLRIEQVLLNLLTNAMKYGAGRPIQVSVLRHGDKALLRIEDHGVGIAHEAQERIFQPFERAASRNYGGLGLGLFITRRIVEAHGGAIRVESEPEQGATFLVELPRRPPGWTQEH